MLCQAYKRLKWQAELSARLLNVPYTHTTFTLPKSLRSLAKVNQKVVYGILFQSAWDCIKKIGEEIGAELGMIGVLHTWGSDLKYHVHIHCLITFGGLDKNNEWVWPKSKRRLCRYRKINSIYRESFLARLSKAMHNGSIAYHRSYEEIEEELLSKQWVVNNGWPSKNTEVIESYVAKYINRSAVTAKRISYNSSAGMVSITHKDYANKASNGQVGYKKRKLPALVAIAKIMQHKLPSSFHRVRYYGIHHPSKYKKIHPKIALILKRNKTSIQILFSLLNKLVKGQKVGKTCGHCGGEDFEKEKIAGEANWIYEHVVGYAQNKSPPTGLNRNVYGNKN